MKTAGRIVLLVSSFLVVFAVAETAVRISKGERAGLMTDDSCAGRIVKPNLDTYITSESGKKVHLKTEKTVSDIMNLGDSMTAGHDVDYDKTFSALMGASNYGVPGYGTREELQMYRCYGRNYKTVILWFYTGNDFVDNLYPPREPSKNPIKAILRKSEFALWAVNKAVRLNRPTPSQTVSVPLVLRVLFQDDELNQLALDNTRQLISELKSEVEKNGHRFIAVVLPAEYQVNKTSQDNIRRQYNADFDFQRPNREIRKILTELGISHLDFTNTFTSDDYLCPNCHLSEKGHRLIAETVMWIYEKDF